MKPKNIPPRLEVGLPDSQFIELVSELASALLDSHLANAPGRIHYQTVDSDGNVTFTELGQDEFNRLYDYAEEILVDNGVFDRDYPPYTPSN